MVCSICFNRILDNEACYTCKIPLCEEHRLTKIIKELGLISTYSFCLNMDCSFCEKTNSCFNIICPSCNSIICISCQSDNYFDDFCSQCTCIRCGVNISDLGDLCTQCFYEIND